MRITPLLLLTVILLLTGCGGHRADSQYGKLSDPIMVMAQLDSQLKEWRGTPYRHGGLSRRGVDCSGFVHLTFQQRFNLSIPRTTREQSRLGSKVERQRLLPGDLVFFKTGSGSSGLHVGIYRSDDSFIHASTSKGVMRSSLNNVYWRRAYWHARRL